VVLVDTHAQGEFYAVTFGLDPARFRRSFVGHEFAGANHLAVFPPSPGPGTLKVLFFGTYVPLHGVSVILEAACRLRDRDIDLGLVGSGQLLPEARGLVQRLGLGRVHLHTEWMDAETLRAQVRAADVCLGIFGTTAKAARVIPYKVLGALALARPVITRDSPAIRELLKDGESAVLCPAGDPAALARALDRLQREPALGSRLATNGHQVYLRRCAPREVGRTLLEMLEAEIRAS